MTLCHRKDIGTFKFRPPFFGISPGIQQAYFLGGSASSGQGAIAIGRQRDARQREAGHSEQASYGNGRGRQIVLMVGRRADTDFQTSFGPSRD
jgi:hypothetical protein